MGNWITSFLTCVDSNEVEQLYQDHFYMRKQYSIQRKQYEELKSQYMNLQKQYDELKKHVEKKDEKKWIYINDYMT